MCKQDGSRFGCLVTEVCGVGEVEEDETLDVSNGIDFFFFQAEDGIRDLVRSRGLGDVYKRQGQCDL